MCFSLQKIVGDGKAYWRPFSIVVLSYLWDLIHLVEASINYGRASQHIDFEEVLFIHCREEVF